MSNNLKGIKNKLIPILKKNDIIKASIFGSYARGEETSKSDIDIIVKFSESPGFFQFLKLENHLTTILKREVDLVTENALKNTVKDDILSHTLYV